MLLLFQHENERRNSSFFFSKAFMNKFFQRVAHQNLFSLDHGACCKSRLGSLSAEKYIYYLTLDQLTLPLCDHSIRQYTLQ